MLLNFRIKFMPKKNWIEFNTSNLNNEVQTPKGTNQQSKHLVRVTKVKKSRGGKIVTTITGLDLSQEETMKLLKKIKSKLGTGGTLKEQSIEIQGNKVLEVREILSKEGFFPKKSGG